LAAMGAPILPRPIKAIVVIHSFSLCCFAPVLNNSCNRRHYRRTRLDCCRRDLAARRMPLRPAPAAPAGRQNRNRAHRHNRRRRRRSSAESRTIAGIRVRKHVAGPFEDHIRARLIRRQNGRRARRGERDGAVLFSGKVMSREYAAARRACRRRQERQPSKRVQSS
jgi:hypothetical protein